RYSQTRRLKRHLAIMLSSVALAGLGSPWLMLSTPALQSSGAWCRAKILIWFATSHDPGMTIRHEEADYRVSARALAAHPYYRRAAQVSGGLVLRGGAAGFGAWLSCLILLRGAAARRRER